MLACRSASIPCRQIVRKAQPSLISSLRRCNTNDATDSPSPSPSPAKLTYPPSPSPHHSDLASFLSYAKKSGLQESTTVYVGTHYEYTAAATLAKYGFNLQRIGGASDNGTDLLGVWTIPAPDLDADLPPTTAKVLIQCKAGVQRVGPQHVRELEGAFVGAPPGWRTRVMAWLVCERAATKGVRDALGRSRLPMGYVYCERDGDVKQMLWNKAAEELGLEGLGVGARHRGDGTELVLTRRGKALGWVK